MGRRRLASSESQVLLSEEDPALPVSLLFQTGRKDHPSVRAFFEEAEEQLQAASL